MKITVIIPALNEANNPMLAVEGVVDNTFEIDHDSRFDFHFCS